MNPRALIRIARQLASGNLGSGLGRPQQDELRRAISTAYYALFHTLATCAADLLIGANRGSRIESRWLQTYRTMDHGYAKSQCQSPAIGQFPPEIREFATQFAEMQDHRHDADYNPARNFTRSQVIALIEETERKIIGFENAPAEDRRAFAVFATFRLARR